MTPAALVLDTNIVLDLLVFQDPRTHALQQALQQHRYGWIATTAMRCELERVLAYPQIARRLTRPPPPTRNEGADDGANTSIDNGAAVLARFDAQASIVPAAGKAPVTCRDPDDQKFIDLAVAHQALLLSRDKAILCMKKRLLALAVPALAAIT